MSKPNATSKPSLIAIFLLITGGLIAVSTLLMQVIDVRALTVGFEMQIIGLSLLVIGKHKQHD
jgi:hypothetical protein